MKNGDERQLEMIKAGAVVIGRNEGDRLKICLKSLLGGYSQIVYVDSGSTDRSVIYAKSIGINVIELDMSIPFTAARARNEGFLFLKENFPQLKYIQFVDGDCEILKSWIDISLDFIDKNDEIGCLCGVLKERYPEKSIYNRICDMEWNGPKGVIESCGGIFLARTISYNEIGGMNPKIIAGEEPEFCLRLRRNGWKIYRLDNPMGYHDAEMTRLTHWVKRTMRSGYAYILGTSMYGKEHSHYYKLARSAMLWGLILPLFIIISTLISPLFLGFIVLYPILFIKIFINLRRNSKHFTLLYTSNCFFGKFPQAFGIIKYYIQKILKKEQKIIEYRR